MDTKLARIILKARRFKKVALLGAACALLSALIVVTGLLVIGSEKLLNNASLNQITNGASRTATSMIDPEQNHSSMVEKTMLGVASYYLQMTIQQSDIDRHVAALSCFASLGGPSPGEVLDAVKSRLNSPEANTSLENLKSMFQTSPNVGARDQGACLQWMFNS